MKKTLLLLSSLLPLALTSPSQARTTNENQSPEALIQTPSEGTLYKAGAILTFSGTATDPEEGILSAKSFAWQIDFHHGAIVHPLIDSVSGTKSGNFWIPNTGEKDHNVFYRIHLTVTDQQGASSTTYRDIYPKKTTLTLTTIPSGLDIALDGNNKTTPYAFIAVVGMQHEVEAPFVCKRSNRDFAFSRWDESDKPLLPITAPSKSTTYTARFESVVIDTVLAEADAYVRAGIHQNTAFGSSDTSRLSVKLDSLADNTREIYLRFPLKRNSHLKYSCLQLAGFKNNNRANDIPIQAFGVEDNSWDEQTITWATRPSKVHYPLDEVKIFAQVGYDDVYKWNVTNYANDAVASNAQHVSLNLAYTEENSKTGVTFRSKETSMFRPRLILIYPSQVTSVMAEQAGNEQVTMFPNPASSSSTVALVADKPIDLVQVHDPFGRLLSTNVGNNSTSYTLSAASLVAGVYHVHVQSGSQTVVKRLVVK